MAYESKAKRSKPRNCCTMPADNIDTPQLLVAEQVDAQQDCNLSGRTSVAWHQSLACDRSQYHAARHKGRVRREMRRWGPTLPFAMRVKPTSHGVGWVSPQIP